jgi:hypothetical protein
VEGGKLKWEVGMRKSEVGPVVVPNERDYAAAKDAEVGNIGHRARSIAHRVEGQLLLEEFIKEIERSDSIILGILAHFRHFRHFKL